MQKGKERRQHPRYRGGRVSLQICGQADERPMFRSDKVVVLDFNVYGLGLVTLHDYSAMERLEMTLALDGVQINNVIGEICYCVPGERTGIRFAFGANEYMASDEVINTLEAIEKKLYVSYKRSVVSSALRPALRRDRYGGDLS